MDSGSSRFVRIISGIVICLWLCACGGGSSGTSTYALSGTISGVSSNASGLVLVNGNARATIATNGRSFRFDALASGSGYDVVVQSAPPGLTCTVAGGSGTLNANVASVVVTCGYTLGGVIISAPSVLVSSLIGLTISNSANGDSYTFMRNDSLNFKMPIVVPSGSAYALSVTVQPSGLNCEVSDGLGTMPASDLNVDVNCQPWFSGPTGIAVDASGNIYIADTLNNAVKQIAVGTRTITTLALGLNLPSGVAVDSSGNVYVADSGNNAVKQIAAGTGTITTLASGLNQPTGVAVDTNGNVYVTDTFNSLVKKIAAGTGTITTLGSGFAYPTGIAVDTSGNVYVADSLNNSVSKIAAGTGTTTMLSSGFNHTYFVAVDAIGNVYATDQTNRVEQIAVGTGVVTTLASEFSDLAGVAIDVSGNVYVTDRQDGLVKEILKETGVIITLP